MKFSNIKTLEHLLKEYGMTSGPPIPAGQQQSGVRAKTSKQASQPTAPTLKPATQGLAEPVTYKNVKARILNVNDEITDGQGNTAGTVVSRANPNNQDKVVIQTPTGSYTVIDPDQDVPVDESKALKSLTRNKQRKSILSKKIKHLARKRNLHEQGTEQLFELNFNTKEVIESALDSPIKCGFEAETVWEGMSNGSSQDVDDMEWSEIEDRIFDEYGRSYLDDINEAYRNWILEDKIYEYEGDLVAELANERKEDEAYIEEFIDSNGGPTEHAVERRKEDLKDSDPAEYESRIEDGWEYINWLREIVEEEMEDEFIEWLEQDIRDNGEIFDAAMEAAEEDLSISDWVNETHNGYWSRLLEEYEIYLDSNEGGLDGVGDELRNWAENNSQSSNIEVGEYHSGGINNDYWRVEDDSSIEGDGAGAEIISPVYQTPRAMLEEIKSLFEDLSEKAVETNRSTGLHVTMSLDPTQTGMSASAEVNKVKLAVLLGDKYIASTFGRENNSYAKSQYERLEKRAAELKADPTSTKTIEAIEQILESAISSDKFSSINFKTQKDNQSGYNLIEFRVAGGHDYHLDMPKIVKSVVRYAETLRVAYTDENRSDYVKALFKLINNVGKISTDLEDRVKGRYEELDHPVVDVLKGFFGKDHYMESVGTLARAFQNLNSYKDGTGVNADAEWEQQVAHWEKQTGETHERLKEAPTPRDNTGTGLMKPHKRPPSVNAPKYLSEAQDMFSAAVAQAGYDLNQNLNREQVNAKAIGVLRKTLPEFELTYETLSDKVNRNYKQIEFGRGSADEEAKFSRVKNGVDRLFKKDIIVAPEFLSELQVEKIISGIWNVINSEEGNASKDNTLVTAVVKASQNTVDSDVKRVFDYDKSEKPQDYIALKRLISGGRGDWFTVGNTIQGNDYDTLIRELKKYPAWEHPVAREHDARKSGRDSDYASASARKMLDKLQGRMNALSNLRNTDPELYINSLKQMFNASKQLLKQAGHNYETSGGNPYTFSMSSREHDRIIGLIKDIEASNYVPDPFSDQPAIAVFSHIKSWLEDQLTVHNFGKELDPGDTKAKYKARTNAVAKWLGTLDTISQKLGFDSQKGAIDNKLNQVQKGRDLQIATHGDYIATLNVPLESKVYTKNGFIDNIQEVDLTDDPEHDMVSWFNNTVVDHIKNKINRGGMIWVIPSTHWDQANAAADKLAHQNWSTVHLSKGWEIILTKFKSLYGISWEELNDPDDYNELVERRFNRLKMELHRLGVNVTQNGNSKDAPTVEPLLSKEDLMYFQKKNDAAVGPGTRPPVTGTIVTPPGRESQDDTSYEIARQNYTLFNNMMAQGMMYYMQSGESNKLVDFLNNSGNTSAMKDAVLQAIQFNKEGGGIPLDYQSALTLGSQRMGSNESRINSNMSNIFEKINTLTLQQQMDLLEKVDSKKLSKVAKGFQHPNKSGKPVKVKEVKVAENTVPDNTTTRMIKKLLSDEMPAWDLKKQMNAYFIVPDPQMISDFRARRSEEGDNVCLRNIFVNYMKQQLDPSILNTVNLKESVIKEGIIDKERLQYIIDTLKAYPDFIQKVYRYIRIDPDHDGKIDPAELLSKERTKPETDHLATKEITKAFVDALMQTPGDLDDLEAFLQTYGKVSYINTKTLMSGKTSWDQWIQGAGDVSKEFIEALYINLFNFTPNVANSDRGPGELGLALLSPNIKIASVGDISIDGVEVEVKGERSTGGGRLKNSNDDFGHPNLDAIFNKHNVPQHLRITNVTGNAKPQKAHFLDIAKQLEEFKVGVGKEYIAELINATYIYADESMRTAMINNALNNDYATNFLSVAKIAFNNYANILKGKGFEDILMINGPLRNALAFKASDVDKNIHNFKFASLDFGDARNGGAIQVSMTR